MWRDRTNLYVSYRQSCTHHPVKNPKEQPFSYSYSSTIPSERQELISAGRFDDYGDALIEMDFLLPRWIDVSDEVAEILTDVELKSRKLEKLHKQHVLPGFNDEDVKRQEEIEIEHLTQQITKQFQNCQKTIQRIEVMVKETKARQGISRGEETMAKNILISLAGKVQEASAAFRKKQSAYLKKLRGASQVDTSIDQSSLISFSNPSIQETDADMSYSQLALQKNNLPSNDAVIHQREREINDIAQSIIELADIFQELQRMIIDQGTMLDRVDYNVERMTCDVKAAEKELNVASSYQKKGTRRKAVLLLLLMVIGMFILLMLKRKNHVKNNDEKLQ